MNFLLDILLIGYLGKFGILFGSFFYRKIVKVVVSRVDFGIIILTSEEEIRVNFGIDG